MLGRPDRERGDKLQPEILVGISRSTGPIPGCGRLELSFLSTFDPAEYQSRASAVHGFGHSHLYNQHLGTEWKLQERDAPMQHKDETAG